VVAGVVLIVVAVAVVDRVVAVPVAAPAPSAADGVPIAAASSFSASALCAGGAAGPDGLAGTTDFLTNTSPVAVRAVMTSQVAPGTGTGGASSGTPGAPTQRDLVVPALGQAAVNPGAGLPAGDLATSFAFDGGGVAVNQVVSGPDGWSTAPCASQTGASWYFAGGGTTDGDTLSLALYNPSSTPGVVDVSFLTPSGVVVPSTYQGIALGAGQLVVENVGDFVQNQAEIGTVVSAQSGSLVAGELQQVSSGATGGVALELGAPSPATTWHFAQTTDPNDGSTTFHLANPGTTPAVATISIGLPMATVVPVQVTVAPQSSASFVASANHRVPAQTPYALTVRSTAAIVVSRSVGVASSATPPVWGASSGTTTVATHWLVPAPGVPGAPGTPGATVQSLGVDDPGGTPARVVVTVAGSGARVATFTVAAGSVAVLGPSTVGGLHAFDVASTQPVAVEEDSAPTGAAGVVSSTGMSFAP
jgi:hypothetical protein